MKERSKVGNRMKRAALALSLSAVLGAGVLPGRTTAAEKVPLPSAKALMDMAVERPLSYKSEASRQKMLSEAASLPAKVDLRDQNGKCYVPDIRFQNPWGTCWSFASISASETSILAEKHLTPQEYLDRTGTEMDLSEKHLAWYSKHCLTEADTGEDAPYSQIGEGWHFTELEESAGNKNISYNVGGFPFNSSGLFSSGMGPVLESTKYEGEENEYPFAYRGKEGTEVLGLFVDDSAKPEAEEYVKEYIISNYASLGYASKEEAAKALEDPKFLEEKYELLKAAYAPRYDAGDRMYSEFDDWSLPNDHEHRFDVESYVLQESTILESPALHDANGNYIGTDMVNLQAIKQEIAAGRAVSIGYKADQSKPGDEIGDQGYMNTTNWAQYTNNDELANHAVTIIGYDDNYKKENFTRYVHGEAVDGSTPSGDGAFIVRNSWGHTWGNQGYFYLSYYDHTISMPESFDFYTEEDLSEGRVEFIPDNSADYFVKQYDFMPANEVYSMLDYDCDAYMANVFTVDEDAVLESVSTQTASPDTTVSWLVILLNDYAVSPVDGELIAYGEKTFEKGGYHRIDLPNVDRYPVRKGSNVSVVMTHTVPLDNGANAQEILCNKRALDPAEEDIFEGVVNWGESFLYRAGSWMDWKDITDILGDAYASDGKMMEFDNFAIKAYFTPSDKVYFTNQNMELSAKALKKAAESFPVLAVTDAGKVTAKVTKGNKKYISVSKDGWITVKKGAPKGTYKVKISVAGNERYEAAEQIVIIKIRK